MAAPKLTTVEAEHVRICERAVQIANRNAYGDQKLGTNNNVFDKVGNPFRVPSQRSKLGLQLVQGIVGVLPDDAVEVLRDIGMRAIKQAIVEEGPRFVGLILGEARNNRNYFQEHHRH